MINTDVLQTIALCYLAIGAIVAVYEVWDDVRHSSHVFPWWVLAVAYPLAVVIAIALWPGILFEKLIRD